MKTIELNEELFKKILVNRADFLSSSKKGDVTKFSSVRKKRYTFQITAIHNVGSGRLFELYNEEASSFYAGQYIALSLHIGNEYRTKAFTLVGSKSEQEEGIYKILVLNEEDAVVKYLLSSVKVGDLVVGSNPSGHFYHSVLRDKEHILAIADSSGIVPFVAMMQAIIAGDVKYSIVLFYNAKRCEDLVLRELLEEFDKKSTRIKVIFVLSEEMKEGYLNGFVTLDNIKSYFDYNTSIFISGNEGMLKFLNKELEPIHLPKRFIRYNAFLPRCNIRKVQEYTLAIYIQDAKYEIKCYNNKTLMQSILDAGIYIPSKCHNGSCLLCRSELVKGRVKVVNDHRKYGDKLYNYIHPCVTYPSSDLEIIVR